MTVFTPDDIATLYAEHHGWLRNWLAFRLNSRGKCIAEDLAHDTFLRILSSRTRRQPEDIRQPRAYLTTIAKGLMVSWLRRQSLERAWLNELALLPEPQQPSLEAQAIVLEALHEIDAVLDTLKPRARTVFLMTALDGMRQKEIAAVLKVSVPTVKSDVRRAYLACLSLMSDE